MDKRDGFIFFKIAIQHLRMQSLYHAESQKPLCIRHGRLVTAMISPFFTGCLSDPPELWSAGQWKQGQQHQVVSRNGRILHAPLGSCLKRSCPTMEIRRAHVVRARLVHGDHRASLYHAPLVAIPRSAPFVLGGRTLDRLIEWLEIFGRFPPEMLQINQQVCDLIFVTQGFKRLK